MSWLKTLVGGDVTSPIKAIGDVVDELWTSEDEKLDKQALLTRIAQRPDLAQTAINKVEAQHRSIFVAGWRPFIGWVCGWSLAYAYIVRDWLVWALAVFAPSVDAPPAAQMEHLMTVLLGMLGLGAYRTLEKVAGRAK